MLYERQDVKNKKYYPRVLINNINFGHITRVPFVNIGKNKSTIELVFADNEEIKNYYIGTFNATYYKVKEIESLLKELNNSPQLEDI